MLKILSNILCDLDPKVKVIGQKAGICDGVPSTSALVYFYLHFLLESCALCRIWKDAQHPGTKPVVLEKIHFWLSSLRTYRLKFIFRCSTLTLSFMNIYAGLHPLWIII